MRAFIRVTLSVLASMLFMSACGSNNSAVAPRFQPEIVNTADVVFSFQATGLKNVSDVVGYAWSASSGSVVIHPSTATTSGTITLNIKDAAGTVIYNGGVPASGDITPPNGAAGTWTIRVTLASYTGTINFAVQMQ